MTKLPVISGAKAARAFSRVGWVSARQTDSHFIMIKDGSMVTLPFLCTKKSIEVHSGN